MTEIELKDLKVQDEVSAGKLQVAVEQTGGGGGLNYETVLQIIKDNAVTKEQDPTVPDWAKQPEKPTYSYAEITDKPEDLATEKYANDVSKQAVSQGVTAHNISQDTHKDIRILISELSNRLNAIADSDDNTLDQLSEIVAYIKANKALIESVTTSKVNVSDIVNDLETNVANKPLSASQGVVLKALIDTLEQSVSDLSNKTFAKPTSEPSTMGTQAIVYSPILGTLGYVPMGTTTGGKMGDIVTYSNSEADYSSMISNLGTIYVATPIGAKQAVNKEYVDNAFVKFTDYPTSNPRKAGVVNIDYYYGMSLGQAGSAGVLIPLFADDNQLKSRYSNRFIGSHNMDKAVATVLTDSKVTLTEEEKTMACSFLGAVKQEYVDNLVGDINTLLESILGV